MPPASSASSAPEPLYPYQYDIVYALIRERLTAYELSFQWPMRTWLSDSDSGRSRALSMFNRLRPLIARGWVQKVPTDPASGIYEATERARASVSW